MTLAPGTRLGAYEILSFIGAGGMGEVYRALDTKLNRRVAIKILPDVHASDHDRIARFHREAQAVAALNHTSIAAIYDLADAPAQGARSVPVTFLVLELIEGDTLADRLRRGPLKIEEACHIAVQILEALEAAHEKGICHRDLKPANIKVSADGAIKVLDFGLAKFLTPGSAPADLTHSPTLTLGATMPGVILGTAAYMSPEQAKGFEADQRSDIFSFGCILFEMLTGRPAFEGETVSDILAGVLKSDVDFTLLPPRLNPRLVDVLRRCLEKSPKKRWHAAADVRVEIEAVMARGVVVDEARVSTVSARPLWRRAVAPTAALLLGSLAAGYGAWTLKPEPASPITRFTVPLPEGQQFTNTGRSVVVLSPDGTNLVYVANQRLHLRRMGTVDARVIAGTESLGSVLNPVFSPDGKELVFYSLGERAIKRVAVTGGPASTICIADNPLGMSWDADGIMFGQLGKGIVRVPPTGGTPEVMVPSGADELFSTPQLLPDGQTVLFSTRKMTDTWDKARIVAQSPGGARKVIMEGGSSGRYLPTGHLVYAVSGTLLAIAFDPNALAVSGSPVSIVEGVRRGGMAGAGTTGVAHVSFSSTGSLAYVPGPVTVAESGSDLAVFDRKGSVEPLKLPVGVYSSPRLSPDAKFVAFERSAETDASIWVYELSAGRAAQQLTFGGNNRAPVWSPDGAMIAFQSDREGDRAIFWQRADGSGAAERLSKPEPGDAHIPQSWSRDGAHLLFSVEKAGGFSLWAMTLKDRTVSPFGDVPAREAAFSPDGRWVAYHVPADLRSAGYIEPFPRTGAKYLLPQRGGHLYWAPKGDEILMNIGPTQGAAVAVSTTPRVAFSQPTVFERMSRSEPNPATGRRNADMMPDGRILGVLSAGADMDTARYVMVVLNWFDELRQRVPGR
jgi:Tol biopolymer transport system component